MERHRAAPTTQGPAGHPLVAHLRRSFTFTRTADAIIDNAWLRCEGFRVARKDSRVTLEVGDAR